MNAPVLAGVFGAWTAAQLAIAVFFMLAYIARRSEREYLLFGLLCFTHAALDAAFTLSYAATNIGQWLHAARLATASGALATALNAHFILTYSDRKLSARAVAAFYLTALVFAVLSDRVFVLDSLRVEPVTHLGNDVQQVVGTPSVIGMAYFALLIGVNLACIPPLVDVYRAGKREAMSTLIAFLLVVALVSHDAIAASSLINTTYVSPYGFLVYGFGVANTLLRRYRRTAEELEETADELRHATDELTSSYLELSDVQEELFRRRQLASVGELAASIAHEVRNPLAIIQNAAANLKRQSLGQQDRETLLEIIAEEVKRLNGLVTELLRFARPVNIQRSDVALPELLRNLTTGVNDPYRLVTELEEDPELGSVWADPALLRLALGNLIENSCQAMPGGGNIRVQVSRGEIAGAPAIRLEVSDEGTGLTEKTLERALDPFFTTRPKGTGLGLPIVQRILEAHDGRVELGLTAAGGMSVVLEIPIRRRESVSHTELRRSDATTSGQ